jgi:hypothetical protein
MKLVTVLTIMTLGATLVGCGHETTPASAQKLAWTRHPLTDPAIRQAAQYVSFTPTLPTRLPPGYGLESIQVNRPPYQTLRAKRLTTLFFTFTNHAQRFQFTETALTVRLFRKMLRGDGGEAAPIEARAVAAAPEPGAQLMRRRSA